MIKKLFLLTLPGIAACFMSFGQGTFTNPERVTFHTEDIGLFWKIFDETAPTFDAKTFQTRYLDAGSAGLKGFIKMRIESGSNLSKTIKKNLSYYTEVRPGTLSIDSRKEKLREYFFKLKELYPAAVFPDVYFVIGAKNTGGTTFRGGLIIGAEMFGYETETFKPRMNIETIELIVVHELVHYQQNYAVSNTLLAQSIREGTADFICELVAGSHPYTALHEYGNHHAQELWAEFSKKMNSTDWTPWLYYTKDSSRPKDLGYWMGYKIVKAYYDKVDDKTQALHDILNIRDFNDFLAKSGYTGQ
jgi:hypothetical protein